MIIIIIMLIWVLINMWGALISISKEKGKVCSKDFCAIAVSYVLSFAVCQFIYEAFEERFNYSK